MVYLRSSVDEVSGNVNMATTVVRGAQVKDGTIQRVDLDVSTVGQAVIAKAIQGNGIAMTSTGGDAGTGDVTISIDQSSDLAMAASQTIILNTATTNAGVNCLVLGVNTTGTPANNLGAGLNFRAETSTTVAADQATIASGWSDVTHATRTAYLDFSLVNNATATASKMRLFGSGGLAVNRTTDPGAGFVDANTGFKIAGTNIFPVTTANGGVPAAGTAGQVLTKTSATDYVYSWKQPASYQGAQVTTAGTTSTGGVMAGLAGSITPATSGRILVTVSGYLTSTTAGAFAFAGQLRFGPGTAPTHGAALTGTAGGPQAFGHSASANFAVPFSISMIFTGLTVGTAYWLDVTYGTSAVGSTAKLNLSCINAIEF